MGERLSKTLFFDFSADCFYAIGEPDANKRRLGKAGSEGVWGE
jgi:hypothetical protein